MYQFMVMEFSGIDTMGLSTNTSPHRMGNSHTMWYSTLWKKIVSSGWEQTVEELTY